MTDLPAMSGDTSTERLRQSLAHAGKIRAVAARLAAERMLGWANPLVGDLVEAADFLEGVDPRSAPVEVVLSEGPGLAPTDPSCGCDGYYDDGCPKCDSDRVISPAARLPE